MAASTLASDLLHSLGIDLVDALVKLLHGGLQIADAAVHIVDFGLDRLEGIDYLFRIGLHHRQTDALIGFLQIRQIAK